MFRARQLEAEEEARLQRASSASESPGAFIDESEDGNHVPNVREQDDAGLFTFDLDGVSYQDGFTDDEDENIFRYTYDDEEQGIGLKVQDKRKSSEQRSLHIPTE